MVPENKEASEPSQANTEREGFRMATIYQPLPTKPGADPFDAGFLADVAQGAVRLTPEQGLALLERQELFELGRWADARCRAIHGNDLRTYVIDRNINYTNICTAKCIFCAFKRTAEDHDSYTLEYEQLYEKIEELTLYIIQLESEINQLKSKH